MIFTEKKITINNDQCKIDSPVVLYRGDYNVEVRFTIVSSPYKYSNKQETNVTESTEASFGQLIINVPNSKPIFSDVTPVESGGAIIFTIKKEMIDESIELGEYDFQIRLFDENQQSRATIPPVIQGIHIKEPIAIENETNVTQVNYGSTSTSTPLDSFDSNGNYIETSWKDRDLITDSKLNKIEKALTGINNKAKDIEGSMPTKTSQLTNDSGYVTDTEMRTAIENKNTIYDSRMTNIETKNTEQDNRLDIAENRLNNIGNDITNTMQPIIDDHASRLDDIEAIDVAQNNRLDVIEAKNQQQDDRLLDIEKTNKRQDMDLKCLFTEAKNNMMDIAEEGNNINLQNSTEGHVFIDELKGNTLVNCNKEPDKEIILNGNINTQGYSNVTLTEGVDGGLVDVALEGNTMVNVCDQKDPVAITKSYTVETGNHVALQGEYDGKCRPIVTGNTLVNCVQPFSINKGMSSAFSVENNTLTMVGNGAYPSFYYKDYVLKPNTLYTLIVQVDELPEDINQTAWELLRVGTGDGGTNVSVEPKPTSTGLFVTTFTTPDVVTNMDTYMRSALVGETIKLTNMMILEGDYTNKPIPEYFEGLQSSFEDKVVTQEMVDNGEEVADNLGKYRVDYEVTGKNKLSSTKSTKIEGFLNMKAEGQYELAQYVGSNAVSYILPCLPNTTYTLSSLGDRNSIAEFDHYPVNGDTTSVTYSNTIITSNNTKWLVVYVNSLWTDDNLHVQVEEGNTATEYESPKESTKTLYLNSPLLEGDTIEEKNNGIYHVHRNELVAYIEGDETSLITDKANTLHELETPTYELIEQSNLTIPSYANGHLDFNTAVPVEKVEFKPFSEELTYLYANTQYTVQFVSDKAITADITLGGTSLLAQSIVAGLNRVTITTPSELVDNILIISGVGANISKVVVTNTNREFGYFEGMKSVGECEDLEITSANSDNSLSNTQQLTHEPLRGVGTVKDRYVLIDGKWYIQKNCQQIAFTKNIDYWIDSENDTFITFQCTPTFFTNIKECSIVEKNVIIDKKVSGLTITPQTIWIKFNKDVVSNVESLKNYLPMNLVIPVATPTYEPIDYNPLEVYSDVTHISINSAIPTNIIIKNHGFNCLLKPNTTYTISSNLGLNTVTTGADIGDSCLRFMDTDTSDVTTMKDVLVLEGDWTTKPHLIPANFSGIESAFEQGLVTDENDEHYGKYKVNVKVANEDKSKENNITFYINEPLRGVGDTKDKVYVKDDKVVVQRNIGAKRLTSEDVIEYKDLANTSSNTKPNVKIIRFSIPNLKPSWGGLTTLCNKLKTGKIGKLDETAIEHIYWGTEYNWIACDDRNNSCVGMTADKTLLPSDDIEGARQYINNEDIELVYQLASPTYEEVEYNDVKLFIESFKNSTLSYNSNVPVTSKLYYSYSVPIVDTVAQTASISDQQDQLIIDMATQVAVMEMMLM